MAALRTRALAGPVVAQIQADELPELIIWQSGEPELAGCVVPRILADELPDLII